MTTFSTCTVYGQNLSGMAIYEIYCVSDQNLNEQPDNVVVNRYEYPNNLKQCRSSVLGPQKFSAQDLMLMLVTVGFMGENTRSLKRSFSHYR